MSDRRPFRWATTGARMLAGTLVAAGFVVAVVTGIVVPWPTLTREPVEIVATPAPEASILGCSGSLLALGRDAAAAQAISVSATQEVTAGVREGSPPLVESDLLSATPGSFVPVYTAEPDGRTRTDVAASGSSQIGDPDLSGYAASACRPPLMESWIVGGATTTGSADILLLGNPGEVPATVELTVYGTDGPVVPPGGKLVVPAGTQQAVAIAGLALGEASPVIRVTATGAPVTAALQASITRTLIAGGVDVVGAIATPQRRLVIPGVSVVEADGPAIGAPTVLRLLSPSSDATASVTALPTGTAAAGAEPIVVPLSAGLPVDVDLSGLDPREYTVQIEADAPLVGALWQTTGFAEGADFAWFVPAPDISVPSLFATPAGPSPALTVMNPTDAAVEVAVDAVDGTSSTTVTVPAGRSERFSLRPETVYELDADGAPVRAGVSLTGEGALAGFPVWSADTAAEPIVVYP
ncbi:DUF5719 family protein [Microbacterium sp. SS28]|uniref:DUF5719 family protein n=1 Tax=Microbacterium sp. SS28 TaxID=2919948 RepID=UPI001FAB0246|nr:DUF5719 family protein [Microbacterium sp. SS28]